MAGRLIPGYTKKSVLAFLKAKLGTDLSWAKRACVVLYENQQTSNERRVDLATAHNGVGFDKIDTPRMSVLARRIRSNQSLRPGEIDLLLHRMPRYGMQILNMADLKKLRRHLNHYYK